LQCLIDCCAHAMEELCSLDNVSRYTFGLLNVERYSTYLKMLDELYLLTTGDAFDLVTIQPTHETVIFDLEDFELVMEPGQTYFLKPAPDLNLDKCIVKKYISVDNLDEDNVSFSDELDFARQRLIDLLRNAIGKKRLKMARWPFENVRLDTFLKECNIPHIICLQDCSFFEKEVFLYEGDIELCSEECYDHHIQLRELDKEELKVDGHLFNKDKKSYLVKEINYFRGDSMSDDSIESTIAFEKAFVIFNHESLLSNETEIVLQSHSRIRVVYF